MRVLSLLVTITAALLMFGVVVVTGGSMEPALVPGDVCVYRRTSAVRSGEMVVFERADGAGLVVHRAIAVGPRGEVRSKGDANEVADREIVVSERVRGPVVAALPLGRWLRR